MTMRDRTDIGSVELECVWLRLDDRLAAAAAGGDRHGVDHRQSPQGRSPACAWSTSPAWCWGPTATQIMADMGADVIKVEPPAGDNTRYISVGPAPGMGGVFVNVNRGKRSVVLDLAPSRGQGGAARADRQRRRLHPLDARQGDRQAGLRLCRRRRDQPAHRLHQLLRLQPARSRRRPARLRRHHPGRMRHPRRPADDDRRARASSARSWPTRSPG